MRHGCADKPTAAYDPLTGRYKSDRSHPSATCHRGVEEARSLKLKYDRPSRAVCLGDHACAARRRACQASAPDYRAVQFRCAPNVLSATDTLTLMIFSVPGTYRFILADNLETEAEFGGHQLCDVRFAPKADAGREAKVRACPHRVPTGPPRP